jgi:tRNA U34 5-methylaminomethyl-2-thiouridine-forming methyltransferase MnmC
MRAPEVSRELEAGSAIFGELPADLEHQFRIVPLKTGVNSLRSLVHNETFHPVTGPWVEANVLHVGQQKLIERSRGWFEQFEQSRVGDPRPFVIWDVGFGAAANVLAAIAALQEAGGDRQVEIYSFDKTLAAVEFAILHAEELVYPLPFRAPLAQLLREKYVQVSPQLSWHLHVGDFRKMIGDLAPRITARLPAPHSVFYDPYSPASNPEMWTLEQFTALRNRLSPDAPCLLTNYTRSTAVRVTLLLAGFFVGAGCEVGEKAETTIFSNQLALLDRPLGMDWLKRIRNSTNSAPLRLRTEGSAVYSKSAMSDEDYDRLQALPQFVWPHFALPQSIPNRL